MTKPEILFVGGVHGVGKTTLLKYLGKKHNLPVVSESVKLSSMFFENREMYPNLAQILWFGKFMDSLEYLLDDLLPRVKTVLVDGTPYDFSAYTDDRDLQEILEEAACDLLSLLKEKGYKSHIVFLTAPLKVLEERILKRGRFCYDQEIEILNKIDSRFELLGHRYLSSTVTHMETEETERILRSICEWKW